MAVDSRVALAKLTSGQTLTDEDRKVLNMAPLAKPTPTPTTGVISGFKPSLIVPAPATGPVQGPMIGNNLGRDAAFNINNGNSAVLSPTQLTAGQNYNVAQGLNADGTKNKEIDQYTKDAFSLLKDVFISYGLESLVGVIEGYMKNDVGAAQAKILLRNEQAYKDRFQGNTLRAAKGLNVLGEDAYLALENDYSETLKAYGLSDYFGVATDAKTRLARQQKMAEVIGQDISATEFKSRVSTVVTRVKNADQNTKDAFKSLYGIGDADLVKYFLDPAKNAEELKIKAQAAEISGAAIGAGLAGTSLGSAEELARLGVDKSAAVAGYAEAASYLPQADFFGKIYDEMGVTYNQTDAESEIFKGTASAKRKRQQLSEREIANFSGSSGTLRTGKQQTNTGQF